MAKIVLTVTSKIESAKQGIDELQAKIDKLSGSLSNLQLKKGLQTQITSLAKDFQSLGKATEQVAQAQETVDKATKKAQASTTSASTHVETLRKGYANLLNQLKLLNKQYPAETFGDTQKAIEQNFQAIQRLSQAYQNSGKLEGEEKKELLELSEAYKKLSADIAQLKVQSEKLAATNPFESTSPDSVARLQKRYADLVVSLKNVSKYYPKGTFDSIINQANDAITSLQGFSSILASGRQLSAQQQEELNKLVSSFNSLNASASTTKTTVENTHGTILDMVKGFAKWQVAAMLVMKPLQAIQNALAGINETLVETENAVISIQRVLDENVTNGEIADEIYRIAQELGQTFDVVQEIAQNFAKAGLTWQETLEATRAAVLALNVAELSAEESSEGLIAIMQQFGYEASQLEYIIDVLNKTADKAAVNTEELLYALQKAGSTAKAANLTFEETVGLITGMSEATAASGQNMGNALKALFTYSSKDTALDTFAALSTDSAKVVAEYRKGAASILDVWRQVSEEMQSLTAEQAGLLDQYFITEEGSALKEELGAELSEVYDSMSGVYDTAGTYRKNYFIALLSNIEAVDEAIKGMGDASGYTMEEQSKYMDTYSAKLNKLQSQWEALISEQSSWMDVKKSILDAGSALLSFIEKTGGLRTTLLFISAILATLFTDKIVTGIKNFGTHLAALVTGFRSAQGAAIGFGAALQSALGIIGLVATAISAIVGAVQNYRAEQERLRQETIDSYEATSEQAKQLQNLYDKYEQLNSIVNKTDEQENEFAQIQEQIVSLLGDRKDALEGLTEGSEEYRKVLEGLTEEELNFYRIRALNAANAAEESLLAQNIGISSSKHKGQLGYLLNEEYASILDGRGLNITQRGDGVFALEKVQGNTIESALENYRTMSVAIDALMDARKEALQNLDFEKADRIENSGIFKELSLGLEEAQSYIDTYFDSQVAVLVDKYRTIFGAIDTKSQYNELVDWVTAQIGANEFYDETIKSLIDSYGLLNDLIDDTSDSTENLIKDIKDLSKTTIESVVDALQQALDTEKESLSIEEKKKAVLEAQKALEDAKNSLSVRRFNAATGSFEWVADEKEIADAEDDLASAVQSLNEQVTDNVITELESGNATNESILAILQGIADDVKEEGVSSWLNQMVEILEKETGVDLGDISFDRGGIAHGLGYLTKATARPEAVNDPELTAKILSPVSNMQFDRYVRDMGILFERAEAYQRSPVVQSTVGNTTNITNNNGATINGVTVGPEQMNMTLAEFFSLLSQIPTKH